jgi:hypothetical protein
MDVRPRRRIYFHTCSRRVSENGTLRKESITPLPYAVSDNGRVNKAVRAIPGMDLPKYNENQIAATGEKSVLT